ncbi:MAG: hypothetical protein JNM38_25460 [Acidobacteria bacterium]|nr:hypothetical protein [Acidobacteriota bacterium]
MKPAQLFIAAPPPWLPRLWARSEAHQRLLRLVDSLTEQEVGLVLMHLYHVEPWDVNTVADPETVQ